MKAIQLEEVQEHLDAFVGKTCYIHLETTQGAYDKHPVGCFIRNGQVYVERAQIRGMNPYRVGLKIPLGWVYAEGLNVFERDKQGRLLLEGHDDNGKLQVALHMHLNSL